MMRYVWRIEPVASMSEEQLRAVITPVLQHYIEGDLSVEADPPVSRPHLDQEINH